jgi:hypothetical protein
VTTLAVVADRVVSAQTNPLRQRPVLLHLLPQLLLDQQRLVRRLRAEVRNIRASPPSSHGPDEHTRKKKRKKTFKRLADSAKPFGPSRTRVLQRSATRRASVKPLWSPCAKTRKSQQLSPRPRCIAPSPLGVLTISKPPHQQPTKLARRERARRHDVEASAELERFPGQHAVAIDA